MVANSVQNNPIYDLPYLYMSGLNVNVPAATSTLIAIAAGQARDSNDIIDMPVGSADFQGMVTDAPLVVNSAVTGANGLDQGALAASQVYLVWLIGDSRGYKPVAGLVSLASNAAPLLPAGYDSVRLLASVETTAGSVFDQAKVLSFKDANSYAVIPSVSVLASAAGDTAFHAIDMTAPIPATPANGIASLVVNYTPAAAGNTVVFRPTGSAATGGLVTITGLAAGVPQQNIIQVVYEVTGGNAEVDYKCSSASDGLVVLVNGYALPA